MLYPDFKDLLNLKKKANKFHLSSIRHNKFGSAGDYTSPFRGQGLDFDGVREYSPGDDIRNIDWRVTARAGKPHIKTFTEDRERDVFLCVDMNETMRFGTRGTFKSVQAAYVSSLIAWRANLNKDRVGACLFGSVDEGLKFLHSDTTGKSFLQFLKLLSTPVDENNKKSVSLDDVLDHLISLLHRNSLIFIVSDFHDIKEETELKLGKLKKKNDIVLIRVTDITDRMLPSAGSILFSDNNNRKIFFDTDMKEAVESYNKERQKKIELLNKISSKFFIGIIDITTDGDLYSSLSEGLKKINLKKFKK